MRSRRWALALVITLMLIDAWMPEAGAMRSWPAPVQQSIQH
jgi:hypothetical protein